MSPDDRSRRRELRHRWESFIEGAATAEETADWVQDQLADYGDEELIHQGLQVLNDHSWKGRPATVATWVSYQNWLEVVHWYDDDPDGWNHNYWRNVFVEVVEGRPLRDAERMARGFNEYLSADTIQLILDTHVSGDAS